VLGKRAFGVDVDQVDDRAAAFAQRRHRGLGEEERRLRVGGEQFVPLRGGGAADRRRIERGGVVDQRVEAAVARERGVDECVQGVEFGQFRLQDQGAAWAQRFKFGGQFGGFGHRAAAVQGEVVAGGMQRARDLRADALGAAGDQSDRAFLARRHARLLRAKQPAACRKARGRSSRGAAVATSAAAVFRRAHATRAPSRVRRR